MIDQVKAGKKGKDLALPKVVMTSDKAVEGEFTNPYALAKARAAYEIAQSVAGVNVKGCFMTKEWEKYIPIVSSAHEMMRQAMILCEEARTLEKATDGVIRKPHKKTGGSSQRPAHQQARVSRQHFSFFFASPLLGLVAVAGSSS